MDPTVPSSSAAGNGGSVGGLAPFLLKTYDMVDDSATDEIVSWSSNNTSFIVWNPPEFARLLLPTYFKHNNFSSFIRQLNTYGFHKIDPERWEFANEGFVKDRKHLLKNIHRKKPIHSHSNPQCSSVDNERAGFEEEIEKLSREKTALEANVLRFRQERSAAKHRMEELTLRAARMEQRQETLFNFIEKAVRDPTFVEHLIRKIESMDVAACNKKRRVPQTDQTQPLGEKCLLDNNNNSSSRAEFGYIVHQGFPNKLRLELTPSVSDINTVSQSTQSSNEDGASPKRTSEELKDAYTRPEDLLFAPETLDLSDTGTSLSFKMDSVQHRLSNEEPDNHISCLLNLTLASSSSLVNRSPSLTMLSLFSQEITKDPESRSSAKDSDSRASKNSGNIIDGEATLSVPKESCNITTTEPAARPVRVNDVFWEHFLTERPGSSDDEESNSDYQAKPYEDDNRSSSPGLAANAKNMERPSL